MSHPKVLKINADGSVVVSTRGLRRIVERPSGRTLRELVTISGAEAYCDTYNACSSSGSSRAVAVKYGKA